MYYQTLSAEKLHIWNVAIYIWRNLGMTSHRIDVRENVYRYRNAEYNTQTEMTRLSEMSVSLLS